MNTKKASGQGARKTGGARLAPLESISRRSAGSSVPRAAAVDLGDPITNIGERLSQVLSQDNYQQALIKSLSR